MTKAKIVVAGSANTDMVVKSRRIPRPGETVTGGHFMMAFGGKGANQAVAAARLGGEVTFLARVGDDLFGQQSLEHYRNEGILTDCIIRDPEHATGVALILVDQTGENCISVAAGANHALTIADIQKESDRIREADLLMMQLEIPLAVAAEAARIADKAGVPVMLDPAPVPEDPLPESLLKHTTYLTPNEVEIEALTGIEVSDEASAREAADLLLEKGVDHVVLTCGPKGAWNIDSREIELVTAPRVEALDSTAAGDAFNGGLATALGRKLPLLDAVGNACLVGASSVTRMGAQPSLPDLARMEKFCKALEVEWK